MHPGIQTCRGSTEDSAANVSSLPGYPGTRVPGWRRGRRLPGVPRVDFQVWVTGYPGTRVPGVPRLENRI
eukprot:3691002-Rhodomonas_salina.1